MPMQSTQSYTQHSKCMAVPKIGKVVLRSKPLQEWEKEESPSSANFTINTAHDLFSLEYILQL